MRDLIYAVCSVVVATAVLSGCGDEGTSAPPPPCRHCVVSFSADRDNTIYDDTTRPGELSAGNFGHLFSGWTLENGVRNLHPSLERRALIRFDVAGFVPAGSTVDSVVLYLTVTKTHRPPVWNWFKLHRLSASWGEGASVPSNEGGGGAQAFAPDATWLHRFYPDTLWTTPGGDFVAAPSGSTRVIEEDTRYRWGSTTQMTSDVQSWLDDPDENFGWIIVGEIPATPEFFPTTKRFASRENAVAATRPTLQVYYTRP
jgi:hypothetical protein